MVFDYCKACKSRAEKCLVPGSHRAQNRIVWCCDFLLGGASGTRIRKQFKPGVTKREAEKYEHLTIADFERGQFIPQDKSKTLLSEVLEKYLQEHVLEKTRSVYSSTHYVKVFKELLGSYPVGVLTLQHLEDARSKFKDKTGRSNASVNRAIAILKAALNWAVKHGYIQRSPADHLTRLSFKETKPRFLSVEEIARFRAHVKDGRLHDYVVALLHTGIRPIDIKALTWGQVDLPQRVIHVTTHKGREPHTYSVPIDDELIVVLERRYELTKGAGSVFDTSNIRTLADEAIKASGINEGRESAERFTIYGLKHCYASHLLMNGATLFDVATLLGHTDTKMILKHYGFLTQNHLRSVQSKINLTPPTQRKFEVI